MKINTETKNKILLAVLFVVACIGLLLSLIEFANNNIYEKAEDKISSGYSVYLDGVEVKAENIRLKNYEYITIDDENRKIILASGHESTVRNSYIRIK